MNKLKKLENELLDNICKDLIEMNSMEKDVHNLLGRRLNQVEATTIRSQSLSLFKELVKKDLEELYHTEELESKFLQLKRLSKNTSGWRPTAIPAQDSYGVRRPVLIDHIRKLKQYKARLESELSDDGKRNEKMDI